jgi:hypothetical protein
MFILTADGRETVSTEKEFTEAFEKHRDHGYACIQLHGDDGAYLSAVGEGFGPYVLEWFPGEPTGRHLRASEELKSLEILEKFLGFLRGGTAWRVSLTWHEVEDEKPPLTARLLGGLFGKKN